MFCDFLMFWFGILILNGGILSPRSCILFRLAVPRPLFSAAVTVFMLLKPKRFEHTASSDTQSGLAAIRL